MPKTQRPISDLSLDEIDRVAGARLSPPRAVMLAPGGSGSGGIGTSPNDPLAILIDETNRMAEQTNSNLAAMKAALNW